MSKVKATKPAKAKGPVQSSLRPFVKSHQSTGATPHVTTPPADPDLARAIAASLAEQGGEGVDVSSAGMEEVPTSVGGKLHTFHTRHLRGNNSQCRPPFIPGGVCASEQSFSLVPNQMPQKRRVVWKSRFVVETSLRSVRLHVASIDNGQKLPP